MPAVILLYSDMGSCKQKYKICHSVDRVTWGLANKNIKLHEDIFYPGHVHRQCIWSLRIFYRTCAFDLGYVGNRWRTCKNLQDTFEGKTTGETMMLLWETMVLLSSRPINFHGHFLIKGGIGNSRWLSPEELWCTGKGSWWVHSDLQWVPAMWNDRNPLYIEPPRKGADLRYALILLHLLRQD